MKVMTVLGTRPELIRLSRIIPKLDTFASRHVFVHTGQNYHNSLNQVFFSQLQIRQPDYVLRQAVHSFGGQVGYLFPEIENIIKKEQPDRLLVLGDTNSALCAVLGARLGIPVYHMEAGNRCFDPSVPEEINRKIIDAISDYNLPYTNIARENLIREGIPPHKVWVIGNPIYEVLQYYRSDIEASDILESLGLHQGDYILVTAHRAENVDQKDRLSNIVQSLEAIAGRLQIPIVCSIHPRTKAKLTEFSLEPKNTLVRFFEPFGFFEFVKLQAYARCVITDSGTVQEESCIFGVPAVTIRQSTERPETVICGSNVVSGLDPNRISSSVELMINNHVTWKCPEGYLEEHVSDKVVKMILGGVHHV
jgi:UDP-N-acetylglucosamine 2-epimerase (non-hydrolysing)